MRFVSVFVVAALCAVALAVTNTTMPSFFAMGKSAFELGLSIGQQQAELYAELRKQDHSIDDLMSWVEDNRMVFTSFCDANRKFFPDIYEEVRGIAQGANISEDEVLALMLRPEIEALANPPEVAAARDAHCFDILYNPPKSDKNAHAFMAHNEDWTPVYKNFGFVLHEHMAFAGDDEVKHITAFSYPASPVGFTFGFNDHGISTSCNGLQPYEVNEGGLGRYFINRYLLGATSIEDAIARLNAVAPHSAFGFAMSIGCSRTRRLYHVEMAPRSVDIIEIKPGSSYLHSNAYIHKAYENLPQTISNSTQHRLERAREMEEPVTPKLALKILGDEKNPVFPIYRYGIPPDELATISTSVTDLDDALVSIWGGNPTKVASVVQLAMPDPPGFTDKTLQEKLFYPLVAVAGVAIIIIIILAIVACRLNSKNKDIYVAVPDKPINNYE